MEVLTHEQRTYNILLEIQMFKTVVVPLTTLKAQSVGLLRNEQILEEKLV